MASQPSTPYDHISEWGPAWKISDRVTVAQSAIVGFSLPPTFFYRVLETGEQFTGNTGSTVEDYMLWKAEERLNASRRNEG